MTTASVRKLFGQLERRARADGARDLRAACRRRLLPAALFPKQPSSISACMSLSALATISSAAGSTHTIIRSARRFCAGDVRITTRVNRDDLGEALFSTLHEAGHAMYEQGVAPRSTARRSERGLGGRARKPVAAVGERGRRAAAVSGSYFYPLAAAAFPRATRERAAR